MYFIVDAGMQTPVLRLVAYEAMSGSVFMLFLSVKQRMVVVSQGRCISGHMGNITIV